MTLLDEAPARPDDLQLIGEMPGSGYRVPPALVRRGDGQTMQLTPLLYAVLEAVDGSRSCEQIAHVVSERTGKVVSAANVRTLVDEHLRPLGLLLRADGSSPEVKRSNPLLGLRMKVSVTDPSSTRRLTDPFQVLFHPLVWVPLVVAFGWISWWLLLDKGLASATYQAFRSPGLLLLVVGVTIVSAGFHEFGHAAAARRGGAQPGVMGAGVYLVWPAFYTDVTDSYRLGRIGRLRTDLGGLYFNALVAVAIAGTWWSTGWDALLLVVATQVLQMIRQLTPLVRFDGYHVLADLTGVPDLYPRIGPTLTSLWPGRWHDPKAAELKPWARAVITLWVVAVVPLLAFTLLTMVLTLPRIVGTAWASVSREWDVLTASVAEMELVDAGAALVGVIAFGFPVLAIGVLLTRMGRAAGRSTWRATEGRPVRRGLALALALALLAGLAWAWWPDEQRYRPVLPFEGGTLSQAAAVPLARVGVTVPTPSSVQGGYATTLLPADGPMPTQDHPVPALVLVPHTVDDQVAGTPGDPVGDPSGGEPTAPTWVFPFDQPLPPDPGDNQALAVNTTDGTVTYDVAVAMVWVTDEDVDNTNEAVAAASCSDCAAVAVAFQVVVIVGNADVVVPQNLATAVNYDCFRCITAAVASQLVVTVDALPGEDQVVALQDLWQQIVAFANDIPSMSLADVQAHLEDYQQQILDILGVVTEEDGVAVDEAQPTATPSSTASPTATPTSEDGASASPGTQGATDGDPADGTSGSTDGSTDDGTDGGGTDGDAGASTTPTPTEEGSASPSAPASSGSPAAASGSPSAVSSP